MSMAKSLQGPHVLSKAPCQLLDSGFRVPSQASDNRLSRYLVGLLMAALLVCCSGAATAGVDDVWNASPATQDTQWAQQHSLPVSPANSGGALLGPIVESGRTNYHYMNNDEYTSLCPDGYVLVGLRRTEDDWFYYQCRQIIR